MPYDEPSPTDPTVLVGVALPAEAETVEETAWVYAEEFARMGWSASRILSLFRSPFYAGAHRLYRALGERVVRAIVEECVQVWGRRRPRYGENPRREGA